MNRIYRLKFDRRRNELVVVSELTTGTGKQKNTGHIDDLPGAGLFRTLLGRLTPVALLTGLVTGMLPMMTLAAGLPTGGQIVAGKGSIAREGNSLTVTQNTRNMAADWHSFDIGKNNTVQFVQPDSSSVALNRVTGGSASQIMGTLRANGRIFLVNPNGILFGNGAKVDTAGIVASTRNISTADFMQGNYTFSGTGAPGAQVVNQGSLTTTEGGFIVLAADRVSNQGTLSTPGGRAVLAAAERVTLQLDNNGLTSVTVNGSVVNALAENRGLISATDGQVFLTARGRDMLLNTVVNNSGTVEAKGLRSRGGEIVLDGGESGVVTQSGQLLADSHHGLGGRIVLEGENIHLAGGSVTSATGKTGGGTVYVGGGWQGRDSRIKNASAVVMDKGATVDVSATQRGDGGTAVLWSENYTAFHGTIRAKGGIQSGNGGQVETSSHDNLQAFGQVDAGTGGGWLLDPTDVTIVGSGSTQNVSNASGVFSPSASGAQILNSSIESQLNSGTNVTVITSNVATDDQSGNIAVNANIAKTAGGNASLTLKADGNITTSENVTIISSTGELGLNLLAGNTSTTAGITFGKNTNITLNGGDFYAGAAVNGSAVSLTYSDGGSVSGGNITLDVAGGLTGNAFGLNATGNLMVNGPVNVNATTAPEAGVWLTAGDSLVLRSPA
ncbi:filamentous hemagglutinin N-terminal domain-containing protein, partial [Salmonella enterica]